MPYGLSSNPQGFSGGPGHGPEAARHHFQLRRDGFRAPGAPGWVNLPGFRCDVEKQGEDLCAGHTVYGTVVNFSELGHVAVLKSLDYVELPKRATSVKGARHDAGDLLSELAGIARGRQADVTHVEIQIKIWIFDPIRVIESKRHLDQSSSEGWEKVHALSEQLLDIFESGWRGRGRWVEDGKAGNVSIRSGRFHVEKTCVKSGELFHQ